MSIQTDKVIKKDSRGAARVRSRVPPPKMKTVHEVSVLSQLQATGEDKVTKSNTGSRAKKGRIGSEAIWNHA